MRFKVLAFAFLAALFPAFAESADTSSIISSSLMAATAPKEESPFKVGLIGGLQMPTGPLKNDEYAGTQNYMGWSAGILISYDLNTNNQLRAVLAYGSMPGSTTTRTVLPLEISLGDTPLAITADRKVSYETKSIGIDYIYSFDNNNHGFYVGAGVGLQNLKGTCQETLGVNGYNLLTKTTSANETGLTYKALAGYHFNEHASLEVAYNYMPVSETIFGYDNASYVGVNLVIKF
jgi:opacity protein-like surface antigen